jgi:YegS/Rv2252/BmrU family lipid kinase
MGLPCDSCYNAGVRAQLIVNPAAGAGQGGAQLREAVGLLCERGWTVSQTFTAERGQATWLAREVAAQGHDVAVVVGGDGTINEVVNGLAGSQTALGVLPTGTANVWAAELGLVPTPSALHRPNLVRTAGMLIESTPRRIDLGRARCADGLERYFLMVCGVGSDAAITDLVERQEVHLKRRLGAAAYAVGSLMAARHLVGTPATVSIDGVERRTRLLLAVACNTGLYAGLVRIAPRAQLDDGRLDVRVFAGRGPLDLARHAAVVLMGDERRNRRAWSERAVRLGVTAHVPVPVQVDGEPIGYTPVEVSVVPASLDVMVPPQAPAHLFTSEPQTRMALP